MAEATWRRYVREKRLMRRYPKVLELVKKLNDEAAAGDSTLEKKVSPAPRILVVPSFWCERSRMLFFIKAAAVLTKDNTKEIRTAALFNPHAF